MPEEILAIILVSIFSGSVLALIRMILSYRERRSMTGLSQGASMTTSELERMMRRAVEDATSPLAQKLEDLEFEVATRRTAPQLAEPKTAQRLDLDSEDYGADALDAAAEPVPAKRRDNS